MRKIDVHAHWPYPKLGPDVQPDFEENYRRRYLDGYDLNLRLKHMDEDDVDIQVLSSPQQGWRMNDKLASIVKEFPERFVALASLPLPDLEKSIDEMDRAILDLQMRGLCMSAFVGEQPMNSPAFWPIFEKAIEYDVPIFVHFGTPPSFSGMLLSDRGAVTKDFRLNALIGYIFGSTINVGGLIFGGVLERYPKLKLIIAHLGGAAPYLAGRWDIGYRGHRECRQCISKPPTEYLKMLYYDTVSYHVPSLRCAYELVGADHLIFGSDYPFPVGDAKLVQGTIEELGVSAEEKERIYHKNLEKLLKTE